jgi:hypothetical protein
MVRKEEETFKIKEGHVETDESEIKSIMERLELIAQKVELISNYLITISPAGERWKLERYHPFKTQSR